MNITLEIAEGRRRSVTVELSDATEFVIGRAKDCDLRLASPFVSRHHCTLSLREGRVFVCDLESNNGTGLNDQMLVGQRELHNGDRLWIAATPIEVQIQADRNISCLLHGILRTFWMSKDGPACQTPDHSPVVSPVDLLQELNTTPSNPLQASGAKR